LLIFILPQLKIKNKNNSKLFFILSNYCPICLEKKKKEEEEEEEEEEEKQTTTVLFMILYIL
jgi:hypothetical protein